MQIPGVQNIMSLFTGQKPEPAPAPAPNAQGQQAQAADTTNFGQTPQPTPAGDPGVPGQFDLDQFKDLFSAPTAEQLAAQGNFDPSKLFAGMEAPKVQEAVAKMSFTDSVNQEQLAAIQAGGEGAVAAMLQVMNAVGQNAMTKSLLSNAEMIKQAVGQVNGSLDNRMNAVARKQAVSAEVHKGNELLSNPAFKPMVDALSYQFSVKNPQATPEQIRETVAGYLNTMAGSFNPKGPETDVAPGETDWSKFL
jgi:hypothetical protein